MSNSDRQDEACKSNALTARFVSIFGKADNLDRLNQNSSQQEFLNSISNADEQVGSAKVKKNGTGKTIDRTALLDDRLILIECNIAKKIDIWISLLVCNLGLTALAAMVLWIAL